MAKKVGMLCSLKLPWLNQTVALISENLTDEDIKEKLNEYLSFEIKSAINIRKTREILMTTWCYKNNYSDQLQSTAFSLIQKYPEYDKQIHWCMLLAAYPVFYDVCRVAGKMFEYQEEITLAQLKNKLFDEWGERSTLAHSVEKIIATLKNFDVLTCDKPGRYHVKLCEIKNKDIIVFMVYTILNIGKTYYTFQEINSLTCLFPFEYKMEKEYILQDNRFLMSNQSGELIVTLKD